MFSQRFPDYFDGIVVCAPAMSVSSGATIAAAWDTATYLSIAPADGDGRRILSRAFSTADMELVARGILSACDADDGVVDGMVQRAGRCRFDPAVLRCQGGKTETCLTADQVAALARAFDGPVDSSGRRLYVGQPWDPGVGAPGWRQWKLGTSETATPNAANTTLMTGALAYEFFTPPDPGFEIALQLRPRSSAHGRVFRRVQHRQRRDPRRVRQTRWQAADVSRHGRRHLLAAGVAQLYQRLAANNSGMQSTPKWARLFLVPGMNHCTGGPATDSYDGLAAIVDWVENDQAPERIHAAAQSTNRFFPNRTRPLCPFPSYARYMGAGDIERAENFACME